MEGAALRRLSSVVTTEAPPPEPTEAAAATAAEAVSPACPDLVARLEFFAASPFSTNLALGQAAYWDSAERESCRANALRLGLMHNIPSDSSRSRLCRTGQASVPPRPTRARNTYVWKPQPNEQAILGIMREMLHDPVHEVLTFSAEFNDQERFVAHLVADMLDLEHQSIDTPDGRMLCVWKRSLNRPLPAQLRVGLARERVKQERNGEDKEGQNMSRVDTWLSVDDKHWQDAGGRPLPQTEVTPGPRGSPQLEVQILKPQSKEQLPSLVPKPTAAAPAPPLRSPPLPVEQQTSSALPNASAEAAAGNSARASLLQSAASTSTQATSRAVTFPSTAQSGAAAATSGSTRPPPPPPESPSPHTQAELSDHFFVSEFSLDAVGQLPYETGLQSSTDVLPESNAGPNLTRQMSHRVLRDMAELQRRMHTPSSPRRIHSGTGEVYTVVDHGSGDKAIFKPAVQPGQSRRRQLREGGGGFSASSDASSSIEPSSGSSTAGSSRGSIGPPTPGRSEASAAGGEDEGGEEDRLVEEQAHNKEVAAYLVDHYGMAGVLPTMAARVELGGKPEAGMIQQYLEHKETADEDEWGRRQIMRLRVREVHLVGALDVRLFNEDRHGGNLLLDQSSVQPGEPPRLVPIDHELTLPSWRNLERAQFCWLTWKQASEPFDPETKAYIGELDLRRDEALLRPLALSEASLGTYRICFSFLKVCVARGLTLRDIGDRMVRDPALCPHELPCEWPCQPSTLERLVAKADPGPSAGDEFNDAALDRFVAELNAHLDACGCPAAPQFASTPLGSP